MLGFRRTASLTCGLLIAALVGPAWAGSKLALKKGIVVHVPNVGAVERVAEPVTFAFPLAAKDKIKSPGKLAVFGPDGAPVPAQFRPVQRWGGGPADGKKPTRWMLVDLQVDVPVNAAVDYLIRKKKKSDQTPPTAPTLALTEDATGIDVDTGTARFRISKQSNRFLERFAADLDGDGVVEDGEELIDEPENAGFVLTDRFGAKYSSPSYPVEVAVEEVGPLRVVVRADGRHGPVVPGGGIGRDFFMYRTRYTFYAGKPYVRVQHALRNAYLDQPLGSIGFEGYALHLELAAGAKAGGAPFVATYGGHNDQPFVQAGASRLYQDSHGGTNWAASPGTTLQGFRVFNAANNPVASGTQATGYIQLKSGNAGLSLFMRDFFENFPKGFAFNGDLGVRFDLFPAEFATFHWLDDGQQKVTDFFLTAHVPGGEVLENARRRFEFPLHPYADPDWTAQTGAWADQGDLDHWSSSHEAMIAYDDGDLASMYNQAFDNNSYSFGWSEFGELTWCKNTHTTGSPRNKLSYFDRFAMTGSYSGFRKSELFALHSRDIRTFHIEGFSCEAKPSATLWEALPPWSHSQDKLGRDQLDATLAPHRAGIPTGGHGWNAFDFEHFVVDDLYEYYLLTGDGFTLDALERIGECVRSWPIYSKTKAPGSTRGVGWTMRALTKIWRVTGDDRFGDSTQNLVDSVWATYGTKPSPVTGMVYHYVTRYPPHNNHIKDGEYDLPWQLATVIHGMLLYHRETGEKKSKKIALAIADYLVKYAWNGATMEEALHVDDHTILNHKVDNTGINTWIPGALALAYRHQPKRKDFLQAAKVMVESLSPPFTNPNHYLGFGLLHWWHTYRAVVEDASK